ncbi:hypothetical protein, variant 2 [Aphanomyces astaci]|uniref:Deacetylase sirtuin-type domain-containing protein n=2 Tax=Aphanomyces astaci TaxID=112090 RepID=W4FQG3_APHAT|nr:hypothetical protein, variant 1 [Aphanomyces astaci]XP_009840737.1 hypothetical protein, variant 2 [Aphanomyces astaci]ETV69722.1 hypothetical protein, variant 1 [Aphanomyces astaci]ETV69723.1 hypothetical protein, variant 2 [Aphanomyces astaci]|eukprot:XP_009840735.1 hypothetical protein, variant 1 [Aphanomyces astaci]
MSLRAQHARGAKRKDVNYAVLHTGQAVPDMDGDDDEKLGKKQAKKKASGCYLCAAASQTASKLYTCSTCPNRFHMSCAIKLTPTAPSHRCCACIASDAKEALPRPQLTSLDNAVQALKEAKRIVVVVGAGISVSCGIPDFRSKDGIYAMVKDMALDLPDPESLFDMDFFRSNPIPFYRFAAAFFNGKSFTPSLTHRFLRRLQDQHQLLRVYSQNVDGLEAAAGVTNVIQCHGTLTTSSCMSCGYALDTTTALQRCKGSKDHIPKCPQCNDGILKPDITFFGEALHDATRHALPVDRTQADLVLVMGTSLQVSPVADIPVYLNAVPQVLINMESVTPKGKLGFRGFDIECLGPCDVIVEYFMAALDGNASVLSSPMHVHPPNRYCFDGCHLDDVATEEGAPPSIDSFHW